MCLSCSSESLFWLPLQTRLIVLLVQAFTSCFLLGVYRTSIVYPVQKPGIFIWENLLRYIQHAILSAPTSTISPQSMEFYYSSPVFVIVDGATHQNHREENAYRYSCVWTARYLMGMMD